MFEELEQEMARLFLERFGQQVEEARSWLRSQLGPDVVHDDLRFIPGGTGDWFAFELGRSPRVVFWTDFINKTRTVISSRDGIVLETSGASHANGRAFFMLERAEDGPISPWKPEFDRTWDVEQGASDDWQDPVQFTLLGYSARDNHLEDLKHSGTYGWWQVMGWLGAYAPGYRAYVPFYEGGADQGQGVT